MSWWKVKPEKEIKMKEEFRALCPHCKKEVSTLIFKDIDIEDYWESDNGREARLLCCPNCRCVLAVIEW